MKIDINCIIELPGGTEVTMTPKEVLDFHDKLTQYINDNWEALKDNE